jgi:hypothetical protein
VVFCLFLSITLLGTIDLDTGDIYVTTLPTRLYGVDFKGLNWQIAEYSWERDSTYQIMRDYGVNMIRRHFAGGPVRTGNTSYRARMDRCASLAAERGMWVIFDLFSYNVGYAPATRAEQNHNWDPNDPAGQWGDANWNAIWTNMGTWFKDHGNVLLELGNEPDDYNNTGWTSAMYERQRARYASTIAILRGLGFDNPIVIPGTGFGTTLSNWPSRAASLNDTNIIFDIHRYWWHQLRNSDPSATSVTDVRNAFNARGCDDLMNAGYRVLVGEFGVHGSETNQDSRDRTWFQSMLLVQEADGYDSCYQSFQPGTDFPGIQGDMGDTNWPSRVPTTSFRYFYEGWGTTYGGIPDNLQYYTGEEPGDGTLTVTASTPDNSPLNAAVYVRTRDFHHGAGAHATTGSSTPSQARAAITEFTELVGHYLYLYTQGGGTTVDENLWMLYGANDYSPLIADGTIKVLCHIIQPITRGVANDTTTVTGVANGTYDAWLTTIAQQAATFGYPLWLRFGSEVNINQQNFGNNPATFISAFQRFVTTFRTENATNVKFVFSVNCNDGYDADSLPNTFSDYYPGGSYVDYVGISSYQYEATSDPATLLANVYNAYTGIKPIIIQEWGTNWYSQDYSDSSRRDYINKLFDYLAVRDDIELINYWHHDPHRLVGYPLAVDAYTSRLTTHVANYGYTTTHQNTTPFTAALDAGSYDVLAGYNNLQQTRITRVNTDAATREHFTFSVPPPPPTTDSYTVHLLAAMGGSTTPGAGTYVSLVDHLFAASAYAAADYVFSHWLRDGATWGTTPTISFWGIRNTTYTVQPVFAYTPGQPEVPVPDWRRPNPYVPDVGDPGIEPVSGPRIPYSLPAPALPTADSTLFTQQLTRLTASTPPDLDTVLQPLRGSTPPRLSTLFTALERTKVVI